MAFPCASTPPRPIASTASHAPLLARLARLTSARGGGALWAIVCCIIADGGQPVQWSRSELRRRTGFSDDAIDKALALGDAAGIIERRPGRREPGQGGLTPIVLALVDTPQHGVSGGDHGPRRGPSLSQGVPPDRPAPPGHRVGQRAASRIDSTPESTSSPDRVESDDNLMPLIDRLAAKASAATADAVPHLMRDQVARVVRRLVREDWLPAAIEALVDEAVRRSRGQRQAARYCWRTLGQLAEEGWQPAHGPVRRPAWAAAAPADWEEQSTRPDVLEAGHEATDDGPMEGDGDGWLPASGAAPSPPAALPVVATAAGPRLAVAALWQIVLDEAARRAGSVGEVNDWRWRPFVAVGEDEFWLDPPPGSQVLLRRVHPHLVAALACVLGRPAALKIGGPSTDTAWTGGDVIERRGPDGGSAEAR